jgi:predicted nucleic acid-binding protein
MGGQRRQSIRLLADTSTLLAHVLRDDQNHRSAETFLLDNRQARFVITDLVLAELATRIRARSDAATAVRIADALLLSPRFEIVFLGKELLRGALARMSRFSDKRLSLTDCASFEIMDRLGLQSAFTFDCDFQDCGYKMLP